MTAMDRYSESHHAKAYAAACQTTKDYMAGRRHDELTGDARYWELRWEQEFHKNMFLGSHIDQLADDRRDERHRALGKQYGIASRTIAELRGQLALNRERFDWKRTAEKRLQRILVVIEEKNTLIERLREYEK